MARTIRHDPTSSSGTRVPPSGPPAAERGAERGIWTMLATRLAPGQARKAIADYATLVDLPDELVKDVLLCVSEAVSNVVFHAYRDLDADGTVEIEASIDDDLRICVRDDGGGFAPRDDSPGCGMGLPIITRLTRTFHLRTTSQGGGTEVVMRFALPR